MIQEARFSPTLSTTPLFSSTFGTTSKILRATPDLLALGIIKEFMTTYISLGPHLKVKTRCGGTQKSFPEKS